MAGGRPSVPKISPRPVGDRGAHCRPPGPPLAFLCSAWKKRHNPTDQGGPAHEGAQDMQPTTPEAQRQSTNRRTQEELCERSLALPGRHFGVVEQLIQADAIPSFHGLFLSRARPPGGIVSQRLAPELPWGHSRTTPVKDVIGRAHTRRFRHRQGKGTSFIDRHQPADLRDSWADFLCPPSLLPRVLPGAY
jgi:hypothetical protein